MNLSTSSTTDRTPAGTADSPASSRSLAIFTLLLLGGIAGNYFSLPLFFGADFIFGSIAVLLILYFLRLRWGLLAAVIIHGYTYLLWGHPYGALNFVSETLFVGIFLQRGFRNLLFLDGCFWLLLGMPLAWFYHGNLLQMDATTATFIMLKQAVNGVFNAMLVSLAISYPPLRKFFRPGRLENDIPLQQTLFTVFVGLILLPSLFFTMLEARHAKKTLEDEIVTTLHTTSVNLCFHLHSWFQQNLQAVEQLAILASQPALPPGDQLQHEVEVLHGAFSNYLALHVEDADGRTIAFSPSINAKGEKTIGRNFSDQPWFQQCRASKAVTTSEVHQGRIGVFSPIVTVAAPIIHHGQWQGSAAGPLDLAVIKEVLEPYGRDKDLTIILVDSWNNVIASAGQGVGNDSLKKKTAAATPGDSETPVFFWQPEARNLPTMTRWKHSFYVLETALPAELGWKLALQAPIAPLQKTLHGMYIENLSIMVTLIVLALFIAWSLSRWLTQPLVQLTQVSQGLPEKIVSVQAIAWPVSATREINTLIDNLKSMASSLVLQLHRLQERGDELTHANQELQHQIEERQRSELEREKMQGLLAQAQKMESVGRLAGGVAHDFNNKLGVIIGYTDLAMEQTAGNETLLHCLREIGRAARHSADLTSQMLTYARKQVISPKVLDLNATITAMLNMLQRLIGENITIVWKPQAELWPVKVDPSQVDQVLANLTVNARDAINNAGTITIETANVRIDETYCAATPEAVAGEYVLLAVADDGCGIAPELLPKVFEPFFTTKGVGEGTGLGLATVYGIARQNLGWVTLHSQPGQGTVFKIYFPRYGAAEALASQAAATTTAPEGKGETILLVEDEQHLLDLFQNILSSLGYRVLAANTPSKALQLAQDNPGIDLLLTDVVMPEANGQEMSQQIAALHPRLRCIFMSGYTADIIARHGVLDEGTHFLAKPFSRTELAAKVHETLHGSGKSGDGGRK